MGNARRRSASATVTGVGAYPNGPVGTLFGNGSNVVAALDDGTAAAYFASNPSQYSSFLVGSTVVAGPGTTPIGAAGPITSLPDNSWNGLNIDPTGIHHLYNAAVQNGATTQRVFVVDGTVVLKSGETILPGDVSPFTFTTMRARIGSTGHWIGVSGQPVNGSPLIFGQGPTIQRVIRVGDPIHVGAMETWTTLTNGFIDGNSGNYVIIGTTSSSNPLANRVVVYNDSAVVLRSGDAVDVDGDGVFDDERYVSNMFAAGFSADNALLVLVSQLRTSEAQWGGFDTQSGNALVEVPLPSTIANCCRGLTCLTVPVAECTGQVAGSNAITVSACGPHNAFATCCYGDYNHDGIGSIDDIFLYLNAWFTGSPWADAGGDGVTQPTIDDIFIFLNSWFAGCS